MFARLEALMPQRLKDIIDLRLDFLFRKDTDWYYHDHLFEVPLIDGTRASGGLMRRKVNGQWQYRRPTEEELREEEAREAW